jgi:Helicase associated domain
VRLEALPGWAWRPFDAKWVEGFSVLERFVAREGDARMPRSHVEDGFPLGAWVKEQRSVYREGRLSEERVTRLEALPGWVWKRSRAPSRSASERLRPEP